jgi:hypothetical protein
MQTTAVDVMRGLRWEHARNATPLSSSYPHVSLAPMRWPRQGSLLVFLCLVFLLSCSQTCLAAGHAHGGVLDPVASPHGAEGVPCHSPQSPPPGSPARCPDCADHVFLQSVPPGVETGVASGSAPLAVCVLTTSSLPARLSSHFSALQPEGHALSPPRYLLFSVLRR